MITDTIQNAAVFEKLSPGIAAAMQFLRRPDLAELSLGKHAIDGDRVYAIVQEYTTKPRSEGLWEAHRKYIDVQFVQSGIESMGWSPIEKTKVSKEYDARDDYLLLHADGQAIEVPAGSFAIFMPHDVHMPTIAANDTPQRVRKIVVKVAVG